MLISRISEWCDKRKMAITQWVAVLFTTCFYVMAFPPFEVGEGAFVFLVPFVIWLRFQPSYKSVALTSLGIGWLSWIVLIFWLRHVTWAGMFVLSGIVGAHFMLWALGVAWLSRMTLGKGMFSGIPLALGGAALWVVLEHVRMWIFTGFPWLPLAASQADQPIMLQSASIFGAWALSFALVGVNMGVAAYFLRLVAYARTKKREICPEFYVTLSILVALTFMLLRFTGDQQRVATFKAGIVQPNVPQDQKWDNAFASQIIGRIDQWTRRIAVGFKPDFIFWPEAVLPYSLNDDPELKRWAEELSRDIGAPIVAGAIGVDPAEPGTPYEKRIWRNSVFLVKPDKGLFPLSYSKRHLVPFGEYIPLRRFLPGVEKIVPLEGDFYPGEKATLLPLQTEARTIHLGSLICYEDVFPNLAREAVKEGAGLLFVATNSAWYGKSAAARQHAAHSVLRAVETRRVVLRVGNDGLSAWIDEYGNVIETFDLWETGGTAWSITRDQRWVGKQTPYVKYGDWFAWSCYGVFAACVFAGRLMGRQRGF